MESTYNPDQSPRSSLQLSIDLDGEQGISASSSPILGPFSGPHPKFGLPNHYVGVSSAIDTRIQQLNGPGPSQGISSDLVTLDREDLRLPGDGTLPQSAPPIPPRSSARPRPPAPPIPPRSSARPRPPAPPIPPRSSARPRARTLRRVTGSIGVYVSNRAHIPEPLKADVFHVSGDSATPPTRSNNTIGSARSPNHRGTERPGTGATIPRLRRFTEHIDEQARGSQRPEHR